MSSHHTDDLGFRISITTDGLDGQHMQLTMPMTTAPPLFFPQI